MADTEHDKPEPAKPMDEMTQAEIDKAKQKARDADRERLAEESK